jgi:hypothetical protein
MTEQSPGWMGSRTLAPVVKGMTVYDATGEKVGTVAFVYLGASSEDAIESGTGVAGVPDRASRNRSLQERVVEAFQTPDAMPGQVRAQLRRHGFIRIDMTGVFASDRAALPDQIESVSAAGVRLHC